MLRELAERNFRSIALVKELSNTSSKIIHMSKLCHSDTVLVSTKVFKFHKEYKLELKLDLFNLAEIRSSDILFFSTRSSNIILYIIIKANLQLYYETSKI